MTILVSDSLVHYLHGYYYPMVSDENLSELHYFATKLGISYRYYQKRQIHQPHYPISRWKRIKAIRLGAKLVSPEEIAEVWRKYQ